MKKIRTSNMLLVVIVLFQWAFVKVIQLANIRLTVPMSLLLSQLTILLPFMAYCVMKKQNPLKEIRFQKVKPISIFFAFLIMLFSYPVVVFLNMVSMMFVDNAVADIMPAVLDLGLLPGLFFMAVLPAFVEETIFRGMLYNTYSKYRPVAGIILSAVLFGLMHMNFNQMPYAIYLGLIMALMLEVTDSIVVPMVMHFTMNASSSIMLFLSEGLLEATGETANMDLKSSLMDSFSMAVEQYGAELSQAEIEQMFPFFVSGMLLMFFAFALFALAIVFVLINAVAKINGRPLKEVLRKKETEEKIRLVDVWIVLFVIYTLYQCVISI